MYYTEINISQDGRHLFATAPRSFDSHPDVLKTNPRFLETVKRLAKAFPEADGYQMSMTFNKQTGMGVDVNEFLGGEDVTTKYVITNPRYARQGDALTLPQG